MRAGGLIRCAANLWVLPLWLGSPGFAAAAAEPAPCESDASGAIDAAKLVRQLGDKSYRRRQQAQRLLGEMGVSVKDALIAARDDADAEIRFRAGQLLERALELDFQRSLENFVASPPEPAGNDPASEPAADQVLPGWRRFRQQVGGDLAARRLFVEMQRAERELLAISEARPRVAGELLEMRCQQLQEAMQPADEEDEVLTLGSICALLFVAGDPDVELSTQGAAYVNNFSHQTPLQEAIRAGEYVEPLRSLLGGWVHRRFDDNMVTYQNVQLALRYNLREALGPAAALALRKEVPAHLRPYGVLAMGKLGGKDQLPALEPLLDDATEFTLHGRDNQQTRTQIRDVALAVMVHLSGQELIDYGFDHFSRNPSWLFNPGSLGFSKPETREKALAKWRAWAASSKGRSRAT
ncbi:MAG TPA: hypothetical protein VMV10_07610 [Pirellulales bacterium]|nr:hypothetical protein [Pirellulales bacterium]